MQKQFKKSDLKAGMVVKRSGEYYVALPVEHNGEYCLGLFDSSTNLRCQQILTYEEDIIQWGVTEVWGLAYHPCLKHGRFQANTDGRELLWEHEETPEYTLEQLIEKVGHEFKIKK